MDTKVVSIKRVENGLLILPKEGRFDAMRAALDDFTDDFLENRDQGCFETREFKRVPGLIEQNWVR